MTAEAINHVYYDPWDVDLNADPYPMFKRMRDNAPLYYNEPHDFYAVSRFDDVNRALVDHQTFSSAKGVVLEILKAGIEIPPGTLIFEDPPIHDIHRNLLSRAFTPRKINALEPKVREFTARCLDPLVGGDRLDFVKDLGGVMPLRVVGMLFGIPEHYQDLVQEDGDRRLRTERGGNWTIPTACPTGRFSPSSSIGGWTIPPTTSPRSFSRPNSRTKPAQCGDCIAKNS